MRTWNGSRAYNPPKLLKIRLLAPNLAPTSFKVNKSLCPETHSKIFNRRASEAEKPIILSGYILAGDEDICCDNCHPSLLSDKSQTWTRRGSSWSSDWFWQFRWTGEKLLVQHRWTQRKWRTNMYIRWMNMNKTYSWYSLNALPLLPFRPIPDE